ncbi:hypothetical protein Tco_0007686 [Tanacetum coccineum]
MKKTIELMLDDYVLQKLFSVGRVVNAFKNKGKLSPRFIGPFKILKKVREVAYTLELPEEMRGIHNTFHVSYLRTCLSDESSVITLDDVEINPELTFQEEPVSILGRKSRQLRNKEIPLIKVEWKHRNGSSGVEKGVLYQGTNTAYPINVYGVLGDTASDTVYYSLNSWNEEPCRDVHQVGDEREVEVLRNFNWPPSELIMEDAVLPERVSPRKGVIRFGKQGKLNPKYIGTFKILERISSVAYKLEFLEELKLRLNDKLNFVEEPLEIMDREVKQLKQSHIPIVKVRWNSKRGPEITWEREDQIRAKYPHLFSNITPASN